MIIIGIVIFSCLLIVVGLFYYSYNKYKKT